MDPDAGDPRGFTPLTLAVYNGQAETVDFLIVKGADPCVTDPNGNTALMGAAFKGETKVAERLLTERCDVSPVRAQATRTTSRMVSAANVPATGRIGCILSSLIEAVFVRRIGELLHWGEIFPTCI